jgi:hypothetical protein
MTITSAVTMREPPRAVELHLLLAAIKAALEPRSEPPPAASFPEPGWISFLTLALEHHAAGLALGGLNRLAELSVPPPVRIQLETHAQHILRQRAAGLEELRRIGFALVRDGIEMIPLKGPQLRRRLFGELAAGPSRDLDFLIRPHDTSRALAILAECGYRADSDLSPRQFRALMELKGQEILRRDDGRLAIEPHIALAPSNLGLTIDHAGLWQRSRPGLLDDLPIRVLEPEDEFLLLAVHGSKEGWARLKWLIDLVAFAKQQPQIDWALVSHRAQTQRVRRMVALSALLLAETFDMQIGALALARRDRPLHALARRIVAGWNHPAETGVFEGSIFEVCWERRLLCDGTAARISYFVRTAVAPREIHYRLVRLPDSILWAYYWVKVVHDYLLWPVSVVLKWLARSCRALVPGTRYE